jgi:hypothetical protein
MMPWFETRRFATLLTMRFALRGPQPEEPLKAASRRMATDSNVALPPFARWNAV